MDFSSLQTYDAASESQTTITSGEHQEAKVPSCRPQLSPAQKFSVGSSTKLFLVTSVGIMFYAACMLVR